MTNQTGTATLEWGDAGVVVITIENPSTRNAMDDGARRALLAHLRRANDNGDVHAIVLAGAGGVFCVGGELRSMPTDPALIAARLGEMHDIVRLLHLGDKPVVAAVEGAAFGSGMSIATACDYVVGSSTSVFGCTFARVGLVADCGLLHTLQTKIGGREARNILVDGQIVKAERAAAVGIVDDLVPAGQALEAAQLVTRRWLEQAPLVVGATKRLLGRGLDALLQAEMEAQIQLLGSWDFKEGRSAFLERRSPAFTGM